MSRADTWPGVVRLCVASVSGYRAAGEWWGVGAAFMPQMPAVSNIRHQTKGRPAPLRTCLERFAHTVPGAENRVGAREAPVYAVSRLPSVSTVQMSAPRSGNKKNSSGGRAGRAAAVGSFRAVNQGRSGTPPV
jgi:hypothetical protein